MIQNFSIRKIAVIESIGSRVIAFCYSQVTGTLILATGSIILSEHFLCHLLFFSVFHMPLDQPWLLLKSEAIATATALGEPLSSKSLFV